MTSIRSEVIRNVIALDGSASLRAAALLMDEKKIGSVGVLERGALVGILTEGDVVTAALVRGAPPETPIREAIRPVPAVTSDTSVDGCQSVMRDHHTRHLLVEEDGVVVGLITIRHILLLMLEEQRWAARQLEEYITGAPAARPA